MSSMNSGSNKRIPITLLTGFLGSGKTTVLSHLVKEPTAGRIAAIINEFGDIDLDHDLIEASSEDTVVLGNGCLCCSIRGSLADTLRDLDRQRATGTYDFDRIVVETSGLVDPTPVLSLLLRDPFINERYRTGSVIAVVDALHGEQQLDAHVESVRQVAVADYLLLSKTDVASDATVRLLESRLRSLNPVAEIKRSDHGKVDATILLVPMHGRLAPVEAEPASDHEHDHAHNHHHHDETRHDPRIATVSARVLRPLQRSDIAELLSFLDELKGPGLLRAKGILRVANEAYPLAIHAVLDTVHEPSPLTRPAQDDEPSRLVVITFDVPAEQVRACLPKAFRAGQS
jgi:G3E family GTPase